MAGTGGGGDSGIIDIEHRPDGWGDDNDGKRYLVLRSDGDVAGLPSMKTGVIGRKDGDNTGLCALYLPKNTYIVKFDGVPIGYFHLEKNYYSEANGMVRTFCPCKKTDVIIPPSAFDGNYSSQSETTSNQIYCQVFSPIVEGESVQETINNGLDVNVRARAAYECGVVKYKQGTTDYTPQFQDCLTYYKTGDEPVKDYEDFNQQQAVRVFCRFVRNWNGAIGTNDGKAVMTSDADPYFVTDDTFKKVKSDDGSVKYERMIEGRNISTHIIPIDRDLYEFYFSYMNNWNVWFESPGAGGKREFKYLTHESLDVKKETLSTSSSETDISEDRPVKFVGGRFLTWYNLYNDEGAFGVENVREKDFSPGVGELRIFFKVPITTTSMTRIGNLGFSGGAIVSQNMNFDVRHDLDSGQSDTVKSEIGMEARLLLKYNVRTLDVEGVIGPSNTWSTTMDEQIDVHETRAWSPGAVLRGWIRKDVVYPKDLESHIAIEKFFR